MKTNLAILLLLLPLTAGLNAKDADPIPGRTNTNEHSESQSPASTLAAQVQEIAASSSLSRRSQAKLITKAVRDAINAATDGIKDPAERLQLALELATAAAKAAPHFAATITSAVTSLPSIAKIEGAGDQIQAAVKAGIDAAGGTEIANPAVNPPRPGHHDFGGPNKGETVVSPSS